MKSIFFAIAILMIILNVGISSAQKRIQFAKGARSTTVQGSTGEYGMTYTIRARSGQKLIVSLTPRIGVGIKVESNGRFGQTVLLREQTGGRYEIGLEESGDYTIFIGSTNGPAKTFTLTVVIGKLTEI
jgi:hypothetical protein